MSFLCTICSQKFKNNQTQYSGKMSRLKGGAFFEFWIFREKWKNLGESSPKICTLIIEAQNSNIQYISNLQIFIMFLMVIISKFYYIFSLQHCKFLVILKICTSFFHFLQEFFVPLFSQNVFFVNLFLHENFHENAPP